jgi:hypothetical protein
MEMFLQCDISAVRYIVNMEFTAVQFKIRADHSGHAV